MDIVIIIILGIVGGVMIAIVTASGIYYSYRTKRDRTPERPKATSSVRRLARVESSENFLVYQDESRVNFDSIAVQPETKRPIRSPEDVYPPLRDEEQDDYLLGNLDMDFSSTSVIPPEETIERKGSLEFTLHYYQLSSTLTLTLIRLGDLPMRSTGFPPDPLVEFEVKYAHDGKIKSELYKSTCSPHLYESFRFEIPVADLGNQMLTFKVTDMMETNIPEPEPPPEPPQVKKRKKSEPPPPPPPPPPPAPMLIGFATVPLVSIAMKKLLSDTEITIIRDIIKIRPRSSLLERVESTGGETMASTTGTEEYEDADDTVDAAEKGSETKEQETAQEEPESTREPTTQEAFLSHLVIFRNTLSTALRHRTASTVSRHCFKVLQRVDQVGAEEPQAPEAELVVPARPSVKFSRDVDSGISGPALLVSLAYLKSSEKLTVIVMKARNLMSISKSKRPDPFVKVYIKMGEKKLKKRSTVVKKNDVPPVWNEAFSFAIPSRILHKVAVLLQVKHFSERGKKRSLGKVVIGATASDEAVDHWNAMLASTGSVAKWHELEEERQSGKSGKQSTKSKKKT